MTQEELQLRGHAFEARIYAENPSKYVYITLFGLVCISRLILTRDLQPLLARHWTAVQCPYATQLRGHSRRNWVYPGGSD